MAKIKLPITTCLLALYFCLSVNAQAKELPLPAFPANFEVAEYQGQKGCIPDDNKYQFAVMENESLVPVGFHPLMDTPQEGPHLMNVLYSKSGNYAYTMSKKLNGMRCVYNKIENIRFGIAVINDLYKDIKYQVTDVDCHFDTKIINMCGSFKAVTTRLTNAGYKFDWSGTLSSQYRLSLLTKDEQSFYLKTDQKTGATRFIGVGTGAYEAYNIK